MRERTYLNFDLTLERGPEGKGYQARVLGGPAGETGAVPVGIPFSDLEIENFLLRIGRPRRGPVRGLQSPEAAAVRSFGGVLFDAVFRDELKTALASSLDQAEGAAAGLRVRLRLSDCPELVDLPWEYLYNREAHRFLALSEWTPLVRYLELPGRVRPLAVQPPLRLLVLVASPTDFPQLDVELEWTKLREALRGLERSGRVQVDRVPSGSLADLQRQLRRGEYHVFHYIGHGHFDTQADDGVLALEGANGRGQLVSGTDLGTLLHDHRTLRLVLLNSCEGARSGRTDPYSGTAQSLIRQGIPAVVAMQFEITDDAAITIAHSLYEAVADGYPLDAALAEARKAVKNQPNAVEWGTPVLYLRAEDARVFDMPARPDSLLGGGREGPGLATPLQTAASAGGAAAVADTVVPDTAQTVEPLAAPEAPAAPPPTEVSTTTPTESPSASTPTEAWAASTPEEAPATSTPEQAVTASPLAETQAAATLPETLAAPTTVTGSAAPHPDDAPTETTPIEAPAAAIAADDQAAATPPETPAAAPPTEAWAAVPPTEAPAATAPAEIAAETTLAETPVVTRSGDTAATPPDDSAPSAPWGGSGGQGVTEALAETTPVEAPATVSPDIGATTTLAGTEAAETPVDVPSATTSPAAETATADAESPAETTSAEPPVVTTRAQARATPTDRAGATTPPGPTGKRRAPAPPGRSKRSLALLVAFLTVVVVGGYLWFNSTTQTTSSPSTATTTSGPGNVTTVNVPGNAAWTDTGIACSPGSSLDVSATGTVTHNSESSSAVGPEGTSEPALRQFNRPQLPDANHAALIASLDGNAPFSVIGTGATFQCPSSGRLFLGINDVGVDNNGGALVATITQR